MARASPDLPALVRAFEAGSYNTAPASDTKLTAEGITSVVERAIRGVHESLRGEANE